MSLHFKLVSVIVPYIYIFKCNSSTRGFLWYVSLNDLVQCAVITVILLRDLPSQPMYF